MEFMTAFSRSAGRSSYANVVLADDGKRIHGIGSNNSECNDEPQRSWLALTHSSMNRGRRVQRVEKRNVAIELKRQTYAVRMEDTREVEERTVGTAALAKD
jgi:hypothetical protein